MMTKIMKMITNNHKKLTIVLLIVLFLVSLLIKNMIYQKISLNALRQLKSCDYLCANKCALNNASSKSIIDFSICIKNCGCLLINNQQHDNEFTLFTIISIIIVVGIFGIAKKSTQKKEESLSIKELKENYYYELLDKEVNKSPNEDEIDLEIKYFFI